MNKRVVMLVALSLSSLTTSLHSADQERKVTAALEVIQLASAGEILKRLQAAKLDSTFAALARSMGNKSISLQNIAQNIVDACDESARRFQKDPTLLTLAWRRVQYIENLLGAILQNKQHLQTCVQHLSNQGISTNINVLKQQLHSNLPKS